MDEESEYLYGHSKELQEKYAGKYVAILGDKIIAVGNTFLTTYKEVEKEFGESLPLIAYIPKEEEELLLI
ncbi:MAG: hypothetical protein JSW28_10480 [Thermoplasmata archaeon]|nr:MAG: hypothetical protein JSW28_10480 [Thermoplasmata archaeon]